LNSKTVGKEDLKGFFGLEIMDRPSWIGFAWDTRLKIEVSIREDECCTTLITSDSYIETNILIL
jgi:hypothetical protein